jgi:peptidyl-prolyl cis-trans isomerase SurA
MNASIGQYPRHFALCCACLVVSLSGCSMLAGSSLNNLARGQAPEGVPPVTPLPAPAVSQATLRMAEQATPQVRVVAVIGSDVFITDDEVWQMVRQRISATPPKESERLSIDELKARDKKLFDDELKNLVERELILADFLGKIKKQKPQAMDELKEEANRMASKTFKEFKKMNNITDEERLIKSLQAQGMSYKLLMRQLERNAMLSIYLDSFLRDKGKTMSTAEIRRYYDDHADEFQTEAKLVWYDLFVSHRRFKTPGEAQQYAEWLHKQAVGGADIAGLIRQYGHGDSPLRGGLGVGVKPAEIQPAEIAPEVLKLQAGQVSKIIPTETGLHILKMTERSDAGVRAYDETVQAFIRRKVVAMAQEREKDKLVEELRRRTTVRIIEE